MVGMRHLSLIVAMGLSLVGAAGGGELTALDAIAEGYVRLVLEVGLYDEDYVDAYFGPAAWKPAADDAQEPFPAERLRGKADALIERWAKVDGGRLTGLEKLRHAYLGRQLPAVRARIDLLAGRKMSFDEESKALYDVVAPVYEEAYFQGILEELDELLPGDEGIHSKFNSYRIRFTVPPDRLEKALRTAIGECRRRTAEHVPLPAGERFEMQFVTGKPWGAAVTYQGQGFSLVEVNSGAPFCVADVLKVAGHEIYPGHHVHLSLLDKHLVEDKGWVEYSVLPLHSPLALVSEGLAEYGSRDLVLAREARVELARTVLFPAVGLDPAEAERYCRVMELKDALDAAMVEAARRYLDGRMDRSATRVWLCRYCLVTPGVAENLISFIERYRSYMISYTAGRRLIAGYIEKRCGPAAGPVQRWQLFQTLLSTPQTPSGLAGAK